MFHIKTERVPNSNGNIMPKATMPAKEAYQGKKPAERPLRADAQRNLASVLQAAKDVFAESGVDAPVREIAERAGVGIGTIYRHFPRRPDLVAAVFRQELEACADEADVLARDLPPFDALATWMGRFVELVVTKQGLAAALHSGDPAFETLPARRQERLVPAFERLFANAVKAGSIRTDVAANEFLNAAASLCGSTDQTQLQRTRLMVGLLVEGLRSLPSTGSR